jgi:hypothetical protein
VYLFTDITELVVQNEKLHKYYELCKRGERERVGSSRIFGCIRRNRRELSLYRKMRGTSWEMGQPWPPTRRNPSLPPHKRKKIVK